VTRRDVLAAIPAAAVCLYYFVYFLLCLIGLDSRLMCLFALFVMACAALPYLLAGRIRARFPRAGKWLLGIYSILLTLYFFSVIVFWCAIGLGAAPQPADIAAEYGTGSDTVVLLFGCRAYGWEPSLTLALRLEAAYALLEAMPEALCLVSGGQGTNETVPEAEVMRAWLISHGIDEARILMEGDSHSTSENVRFSKDVLAENGLADHRIVGVSTAFHLPRIGMLSERYGLPMALCGAPSPSIGHHYVSMVREYLSYIKMALFDQAVLITKVV